MTDSFYQIMNKTDQVDSTRTMMGIILLWILIFIRMDCFFVRGRFQCSIFFFFVSITNATSRYHPVATMTTIVPD